MRTCEPRGKEDEEESPFSASETSSAVSVYDFSRCEVLEDESNDFDRKIVERGHRACVSSRVGRAMDRSNALGGEFKITRASSDIYCATVCASRDYSYLAEGNILMVDSRPAVEPSAIVAD